MGDNGEDKADKVARCDKVDKADDCGENEGMIGKGGEEEKTDKGERSDEREQVENGDNEDARGEGEKRRDEVIRKYCKKKVTFEVEEEENIEEREIKTSWKAPERKPSMEEKKKMIGVAVKLAIIKILRNHCYEIDGEIYLQGEKGLIGHDLMRSLARVYMIDWVGKYKDLCKEVTENSDSVINLSLIQV